MSFFAEVKTDTLKIAKKYLPPISLLLISILGVAYAATNLFTQTFPAIPAVEGITINCTSLTTYDGATNARVSSIATASSGSVEFDCSGTSPFGASPAFGINLPGGTITATPAFTIAAPYTGVDIVSPASYGCGRPDLFAALTSGTGISLPFNLYTTFSYCAQFQNAPSTGLPTLSIAWTTPTTPFTQTFPAIPASTAITNNCAALTPFDNAQDASAGSHMTSVAIGSSGTVYFDCSGTGALGTTYAFSVVAPGASVSFTPQFTLPSPYIAAAIVQAGSFCRTVDIVPSDQITSGAPFTFSGSHSYGYCLEFQSVPSTGLPTFDVTWTT